MKGSFRCCYFFALVMVLANHSYAQYNEKDFIRYTVRQGLSDNNVTSIQQDDRGYLWIGTDIGLNRFDGYQFKNYYRHNEDLPLGSSNIRKIIYLPDQRLGIVTRNGFHILKTSNLRIINYFIPDTTSFVATRNMVWDAAELKDGSVILSTASGFYQFDKHGDLVFEHDTYKINDVSNIPIFYGRNILNVGENSLLVYTGADGLAHFDNNKKIFSEVNGNDHTWNQFMHPPKTKGGPWVFKSQISNDEFLFLPRSDTIIYYHHGLRKRVASPLPFFWSDEFNWESNATMIDDSTFVINCSQTGFYFFHIDKSSGVITCDPQKHLGTVKVNLLSQDKDKRLWAGTTQGLYQQILRPGFIRRFDWSINDNSNKGYTDGMYYKDKLYLARYSRDAGIVIVDTATMEITGEVNFFGKGHGWNEALSLAMYHPDTIWIGTFEGLLWLDTKTNRYGKVSELMDINASLERVTILGPLRPDGSAWMLSNMNGIVANYVPALRSFKVFTADTKPALPFRHVKGIAYDAFGDVWISGHSLSRWNTRENYFDTLITSYGGINKYDNDIVVMSADDDGSLWMHNGENGLLEYRIKQKEFVPYSMKDGLPSDVLRCFSPVIDHTLWIGSHNHLTRFDTKTKKMEVYGYQEGLPDHMPVARKIIPDASKRNLLMFYVDEVIQFPVHPASYPELASELLIEEVTINNSQTYSFPQEGLTLKSRENNISVHYAIVDYENNHNYQFSYKLNGDLQWTSLGQQRNINLTNLSPGNYAIQISAKGKSGDQKTASLNFTIRFPFWKTGWFLAFCLLTATIVFYSIYRFRMTRFREKANVDKLLSQTEMKALHAQMNPHFIFNSLNSIREMILNGENREASRFLSKFAHLIRLTLDQSSQTFISLRNTIDYLQRYVEMERIRNANFHCSITVDPELELDETVLPPMLIQPFIENSIWHGSNGKHQKIDIKVKFCQENGQLICVVEDNGIGINQSLLSKNGSENMHQPVGISNIISRIELLNTKHHLKSSVTVVDKSTMHGQDDRGTLVTLRLPLEMSTQ